MVVKVSPDVQHLDRGSDILDITFQPPEERLEGSSGGHRTCKMLQAKICDDVVALWLLTGAKSYQYVSGGLPGSRGGPGATLQVQWE